MGREGVLGGYGGLSSVIGKHESPLVFLPPRNVSEDFDPRSIDLAIS